MSGDLTRALDRNKLPLMGKIYDNYTQSALDRQGLQLKAAIADKTPAVQHALQMAQTEAAPYAFRYVSAAAIVLIVVFGVIWLRDRASGGYIPPPPALRKVA